MAILLDILAIVYGILEHSIFTFRTNVSLTYNHMCVIPDDQSVSFGPLLNR
jgi:hypothetical protein